MRIEGATMVLEPQSGFERRRHPDDPSGDYDEPVPLIPRTLSWDLTGEALTLVTADGLERTFARIPQ